MSVLQFDNLKLPSVSIARISPKISEQELFLRRQCYIGISLDNPVFRGKSLDALFVWAVQNFDRVLVVVGDYLRRHNEYMLTGLDGQKAEGTSIAVGDEFVKRTADMLSKLPSDKISVTRWRPLLDSKEYVQSKAVLDDLFASNDDFHSAVEKDARSFIGRQKKSKRRFVVNDDEAINISCEYLLEEIAVFSALSEQGWDVELYPGPELSVLLDVAEGRFPAVPKGLQNRVNVQLHVGGNRTDQQ